MKVCLVIPPSSFLLDERVFPSLGVLKVAAALEQAGVSVHVLDLSGVKDVQAVIERIYLPTVADDPPTVFGITATMPQMPSAVAITETLRNAHPDARFILGGPHVTLTVASARQETKRGEVGRAHRAVTELQERFDVLVAGDGEKAIWAAMDSPGSIIDADDPASDLFLSKTDLDESPLPARHLIDIGSYKYEIDGVPTMSMIAQLGCPFGCAFCGGRRSPFLRRVRMRSTEQVITEMHHLYTTYGNRGFMFLDDELNVNPKFMELLAQMRAYQDRHGVEFRMRGLVKSELMTPDMARAMYDAGFRNLLIGFESGSPRILENIQKRATVEDNTRCVETLREAGIRVKALMSIGHAGESPDTVTEVRDWLLDVRPDDFDVTIITVYPGTPYYDDARELTPGVWTYADPKSGDRLHACHVDQLHDVPFYKGIPGQYQSFVWTDFLTASELVQARDWIESDVRKALRIPYPVGPAALQFEHSMGTR